MDGIVFLSPLLGFGFVHALMLGWLGAAAAPLVIHLWNKRKYREVPWAAMEYLLAALRKNSRRIQVEQWLLLAVRTLLVVLLVLAVAEPFLERAGLNFVAGQRTLKVIVIDGSYSMAYKPTDKSRFERAKQLAAQIVEDSAQGDGFTLILMAAPPAVIVGTPALEPRDFLQEIENLKLPHGGGDLPATLAKVEQVLQASANSGLERKEVYFLTDLGRTSWVPDLGGAEAAAEYRRQIESLSKSATLLVEDLGQDGAENMAVSSLRAAEPFVTVGRDVTLEGVVRNFGNQPRHHQPVELWVDGRRAKESVVDIPAAEQTPVSFTYRFETPADHAVELRLGPDLLDIDNHRWLSLPVKEHLRVLCVDGKPGAGGQSSASYYIARALNPEEAAAHPIVKPETAAESALSERDLGVYDCVFLCNVGQFTAAESRLLEAYLKQGGGLVFFLGDQVLAEPYNRELGGEHGPRVLPARIAGLAAEAQYHFDPLEYRHPLVSPFSGSEQSGLLTTPVFKYFRLTPTPKAKVALAFEGGDPAIVEEPIQRGRTILVATDGSLSSIDPVTKTPWTTMPTWPSFVPIVQELLALAVSGKADEQNVEVGQPLSESVEPTSSKTPLTLATPDGRREDLRLSTAADGSRWTFADTSQSGIYTAELGLSANKPSNNEQLFAVNVDTGSLSQSESNLAKLDPRDLPPQFATSKRSDLDEPDAGSAGRKSALHRSLLYTVLGLLFVETFLAWRAGRYTS